MPLNTPLQQFTAKSRYARYLDDKKRREDWPETVARYMDFAYEHISEKYPQAANAWNSVKNSISSSIENLETMPSMRLVMTAGDAVKRDNIAAYNCFYAAIDKKRRFSDALAILLNGTGVGFSCERQEIVKLPPIPEQINKSEDTVVVQDSKKGWANAYKKLIGALYNGEAPRFDYSKVRSAGSRLKTFGGRASGPRPLQDLFEFTVATFKTAAGRKLTSIEVHDIMCKIAEVVVVGGVRRSALISLSNLSDNRMRDAKIGAWWENDPQRAMANDSAVYTEKPDAETFMGEWLSLIKSKSGERGVFNRQAAQKQAARWGRRPAEISYGSNPCNEILLRSNSFCNLTEVIVRPKDTLEDLKKKIEICTILGTYQSTLTDFDFIDSEAKTNAESERLLGVSLTGIMDHPVINKTTEESSRWLQELRDYAREVNKKWAAIFEINESAAITCVKPSGTVSVLCDAGTGGIHPRFSQYYIRTVRQDNKDPLTQFLKEQGVYSEPDVTKSENTTVFYFPVKGPSESVFRNDRTALEQLEHWMMFQRDWCEHKPSATIYVKDSEWLSVGAWVYDHFDEVCGLSFLPFNEHSYRQAPFQEITETEYSEWMKKTPSTIDWSKFVEEDDLTSGSQELACVGGACSI